MQTREAVNNAISEIYHPAINLSLVELGILKDIDLWGETVIVTFVFPFPNIPIADKLINLVQRVVEGMGLKLEYIVRIMKENERKAFLLKEKQGWKGL